MNTIPYLSIPGTSIDIAASESHLLARQTGRRVRFNFNGVALEATPKKSWLTILWEFEVITGQRSEAWRLSRKGQTHEAIWRDRARRLQSDCDTLIASLDAVLSRNDLGQTMAWIRAFQNPADHTAVHFDRAAVADTFERHGFSENQHVGQPCGFFNTRKHLAEYIVGQTIACLRIGMGPHQVTHKFIDDYFALPN